MKSKRLYEDRKIVLEKFDNNDYRVTFFNDDNHWGGDITFNEKDGVTCDDVKEDDVKIKECMEYAKYEIEKQLPSDEMILEIVSTYNMWSHKSEGKNFLPYLKEYFNDK